MKYVKLSDIALCTANTPNGPYEPIWIRNTGFSIISILSHFPLLEHN